MTSRTTKRFRQALAALPTAIRNQAATAYQRFRNNPHHQGLRFKKVHPSEPIYSVRINVDYRAVGILRDDVILWFWIGKHEEYEQLLKQL